MELIDTIRVRNVLGEGVQWDAENQTLWWTDIQSRRIHCCRWAGRELLSFEMPERVGSFGLVQGRDEIIAAFESGIALCGLSGGAPRWLARPDEHLAGVRFNDGRTDRQGRFWAGTMEETEPRSGRGNLYCVDARGRVQHRESGIMISNGLCWSPDSRTLYFANSSRRTMYAYDFDPADGAISNRRIFAQTPQGAHPDGATVDEDGCVWSAHWGAGCVVRYTPRGKVDRVVDVPASQPTCVAFGGPDLDHLFVTSARDGLSAGQLGGQPSAGDVFVYKVRYKGVAETRFLLS